MGRANITCDWSFGREKGKNEADVILFFFNVWEQLFKINPQIQGGEQISSKATKRNQHSDVPSLGMDGD